MPIFAIRYIFLLYSFEIPNLSLQNSIFPRLSQSGKGLSGFPRLSKPFPTPDKKNFDEKKNPAINNYSSTYAIAQESSTTLIKSNKKTEYVKLLHWIFLEFSNCIKYNHPWCLWKQLIFISYCYVYMAEICTYSALKVKSIICLD